MWPKFLSNVHKIQERHTDVKVQSILGVASLSGRRRTKQAADCTLP